MTIFSLVSHSQELLRVILKSNQPTDRLAADYLRRKKYIGSNDRKFISEITFNSLRRYYLYKLISSAMESKFDYKLKPDFKDKELISPIIVSIALSYSNSGSQFDSVIDYQRKNMDSVELPTLINALYEHFFVSPDQYDYFHFVISTFNELKSKVNCINEQNYHKNQSVELLKSYYSIQDWIIENLIDYYGLNHSKNLLESLCHSAEVCLRVNQSFARREDVSAKLDSTGVSARRGKFSPSCLILNNRVNLSNSDLYKSGLFEVQDQGSQLISLALDPNPGESILDACAGAGGKTLHIADLMKNQGQIVASDIEFKRLKEISIRARRCNFDIISTKLIKKHESKDPDLFRRQKFDRILVDAPCSGMGTVRRMPMPKYRLGKNLLARLAERQLELLTFYSQFLKPGGILVYATCSLMPQENSEIAEKFLAANTEFSPDTIKPIFASQNVSINELSDTDYFLSLNPYDHESDGFFMARFRKD
jgi:16S rRNA (cytosine(967)-C(5))-methyltransferase